MKKKPLSGWVSVDREPIKGMLQISTYIPRIPDSM